MHFSLKAILVALVSLTLAVPWADAQIQSAQFVAYPCQYKSVDEVAALLRPLLPKSPSVQLVIDHDQNRILLSGNNDLQAVALRLIRTVDRPPRRPQANTPQPSTQRPLSQPAPQAQLQPTPNQDRTGRLVFVSPDRFLRLHQQLDAVFGARLSLQRYGSREILLLALGSQPPQRLEIEFDAKRRGVLIGGPAGAVSQLAALIQALDGGHQAVGTRAQVFRLDRKNHRSLQGIINSSPSGTVPRPAITPQADDSMGLHDPAQSASSVALVGYLSQEENPTPPVSPTGASKPPNTIGQTGGYLRQFEGVEIEPLPDLDVIILRGRDGDLDQLTEIIQQLEKISKETQPEIRIYPLRHTQSQAVAELVSQVSDDLVNNRTGKVTITPLIKPNSLLLIGWGDAVNAMIELIRRLDQPVAAQTQSAVFRLKFASATSVQETLNGFFANREGLGPRVQSTVDTRTNSIVVYAAPRDMMEVRHIIEKLDRPDSAAINRARIFQIRNALAGDVAQTLQQAIEAAGGNAERSAILELQVFDAAGQKILRSGTLENVRITPNVRNNTIIVSSPLESLALIAELIRQLDSPLAEATIKVFRIVNGDAASLAQMLRSLLPSQVGSAIGPQLPSAANEISLAPLRFSIDVRSNSIIATGSEGDLRIVEALLIKLDQSNATQRKTTVYQLKNSPAANVAAAVNQFLASRRQVEQSAPGTNNPFQDLEREVVVVAEPIANKLVLSATPRYFDEISELIEKLDEPPPQVLIQVLIAEIALDDTDEFGVELGIQDSVLFDRSLLGDLITTTSTTQTSTPAGIVTVTEELIRAATNLPGFGFNSLQPLGNSGSTASQSGSTRVGSQGLSNFAVGRGSENGFGGLVLSANSQNVSVLIRALQESRRVDILSRPQIRTLDNQPAYIQVGQRVPRIIGSSVNQNGQSNSVTLENVGLILGVTPRISPDGTVVMEIDAEKSSLGPEQDGVPVAVSVDGTVIRSPRIDTTTAQATVSAADGETIVLGGLITKSTSEFHRQVPWLGDIPVLGRLFRYDGTQSRRTELMIILTPRVIRTPEDNARIRQTEMARMDWCAADIFEMHGDIGFSADAHPRVLDRNPSQVIYPDLDPSGQGIKPPTNKPMNDRQ